MHPDTFRIEECATDVYGTEKHGQGLRRTLKKYSFQKKHEKLIPGTYAKKGRGQPWLSGPYLCHHGIFNEGRVFVLPRYVKGTANVYESIRCLEYIEDWSVPSALSSVYHEARPYFLVKWGQDPDDLLLQTIIGHSQNFGFPSGPSGQNSILSFPIIQEQLPLVQCFVYPSHVIDGFGRDCVQENIWDSPEKTEWNMNR